MHVDTCGDRPFGRGFDSRRLHHSFTAFSRGVGGVLGTLRQAGAARLSVSDSRRLEQKDVACLSHFDSATPQNACATASATDRMSANDMLVEADRQLFCRGGCCGGPRLNP